VDQVNILVVDSTSKNLEFLAQILGKQNYNVLTHSTLGTAWQVVESGWAKLVLLNFDILDSSADECWHNLQFHPKAQGVPILFFSGDRQKGQERYLEIQLNSSSIQTDYISNFLEPEEVLIRVKNQLIIKTKQAKINQDSNQLLIRTQQKTAELESNNIQLKAEIEHHNKTQNTLIQLALYDSVTGLPNRNSFLGKLKRVIPIYQQQSESKFAVLLIGSKQIEQAKLSSDHVNIKQLFIAIADSLKACLPSSATLSRLNKWLAIIQEEFSRSCQSEAKVPLNLDLENINIACEIGVVLHNNGYAAAYEVLLNAEKSLIQAQSLNNLRYHFFTNESDPAFAPNDSSHSNLNLDVFNFQNEIDQGNKIFKIFKDHFYESVIREKISLSYQPIFSFNKFAKKDLTNNQIVGLEILDNLHTNYRKIILLTNLFEEIEDSDFNNYLTNFTLEYACFQLRELQTQNQSQRNFFLTIKLTKDSLLQSLLMAKINNILRETDLDPKFLHIDVYLDDQTLLEKSTLSIIKELTKLGIFINLDCSNSNYETLVKVSEIIHFNSFKLPGIVTPPIVNQEELFTPHSSNATLSGETEVVKIINLVHQKNITVMAKGIETVEQLNYLSSVDCDYGQGSWFSKPLDKKELESFLIWRT